MSTFLEDKSPLERVFFRALVTIAHSPAGRQLLDFARLPRTNGNCDWIDLVEISLNLDRLPTAFDGYRIAQISDMHLGTWLKQEQFEQAIELVNQQRPDLVAITGDFVTFHPERYAEGIVRALNRLTPKDAVLVVLGNHDHWTDASIIRQALEESGVIDLSNAVYTLGRGEDRLHFAGVDDHYVNKDDLGSVLQQLPAGETAILLAHEPDYAETSAAARQFSLQLSGHSHGGQIRLPFFGPLFLPQLAKKYPSGLYRVGDMYLYTNRGLGTAELPVRLNCRPEITVFTLNASIG